jgi:hypothetical protein
MAVRFNPPPNWPPPPSGWAPPPGWQPDPAWGPAPQGWPLWVDDGSSPLSGSGVPLQPGTRPWYRQWRVLGPAVLVVLLVVGVVVGGASGETVTSVSAPTATEEAEQPSSPPSAPRSRPSPTPEPSPEPPPVPEPLPTEEYSGSGAQVVTLGARDPRVVTIDHTGAGNFAVWAVDDQGQDLDLLVNEIGSYSGVHPLNFLDGEEAAALRIEADGQWRVSSAPLTSAPSWDGTGTYTAESSAVVLVEGVASGLTPVTLTHQGGSNFAVWAYGDSRDLLVNEIGPYSGETLLPTGTLVLTVEADGPWSIAES